MRIFSVSGSKFQISGEEASVNEKRWSRPVGSELEENRRAVRGMRVIVWVAVGFTAGLCLWAGLFIGMKVF